ncbi:MAG: glyoxylase-like metal-dependent hydrolase (beta-lactamase superfamily II) [Arenicella sp.]|jgi:glyoxylase-like metal-dependent hydrolase (beta-lactamase superfamily II)
MNLINLLKKTIIPAMFAAISMLSVSAVAQDQATLSYKTEKITDTIYMLSGEGGFTGGNVALSVGSDGVAMIDNGVSSVIDILKAEIAEITEQPIDYMINTHIHGDHIGNNHVFGEDGAKIVSHENLRASLIKDEKNGGPSSFPVLTFSDKMTIHLNGDAAQIIHFANAHTDGDAVVYFQNDNVLHTGDIMFNKVFPFIDGSNGGGVDGVIRALESIAAMINDETKVIPGHGPLANKDDVLRTLAMVKDAKALVGKMVEAGKSDEEVVKANPLSAYESYSWGFITTEKMTKQVLAGFSK